MNNKTLYYQSQIPQTLKYGSICCLVGILSTSYHTYVDLHDFGLYGLLPSRILVIASIFLFLIFSQTLFKRRPDWIIPFYTWVFIACFINMTFMLHYSILSTEMDFIYVIGYLYGANQYILSLALFSFGASRYFPRILLIWFSLFTLYYLIMANPFESRYFIHIIIPSVIGFVIVNQRERYFYKNFVINQSLQEKEAILSLTNKKVVEQNEKLKASNQLLETFAHRVSHDLKAPLRSIIGFGGLLKRRYGSQNDEAFNDYLNIMTESSSSMNTLINDLLLYSKIQSEDTTELEPVDLEKTMISVLNNLHAAIEASNADIIYQDLPTIYGKKGLIIQVIQNLLSNAIKYQPEGQTPIVMITATQIPKYHKIEFKDNGIGIPKDKYESIFKLFERLHGVGEYKRHGIGLASTKTIIESLNGKIEIESEVGEGSNFIIYFPVEQKNLISE